MILAQASNGRIDWPSIYIVRPYINEHQPIQLVIYNMKNYLIIGASSGIGKSLSELLNKDGHRVFGTYHSHVTEDKERISFHSLNVLDEQPDLSFMPGQLDGLVYCPGSIQLRPFARIKAQSFMEDYHLQVVGAVKVIQAALPALTSTNAASIVLFSTVAVQNGFNFHSLISASKGAIEGLTRALAAELAPKIRVNAIAPSLTDTPLASSLLNSDTKRESNADRHPLKRIGIPADMAQMAHFLLSERAGWMTGQVLHVDGGISALRT
jgi:NAD(P)-dependent dehydrogenase (short-subunit alcohol dehydrogenase family)